MLRMADPLSRARAPSLAALFGACLLLASPIGAAQAAEQDADALFDLALAGAHRSVEHRERDDARNPRDTLQFFGWKPSLTVLEVWPGGGWYTEILAPLTRPAGAFYAAGFGATGDELPEWRANMHGRLAEKLAGNPEIYDHVVLTALWPPSHATPAPPESVDLALVFRNVHSWMRAGIEEEMFNAIARTLKPGGALGVVQHRAEDGVDEEQMRASGYVSEAHVIALAAGAGLELEERSDINANPRDSRDHPEGVWTLPPTLRHCSTMEDKALRDECEERYRAIGESDRMTLRFRKPSD